MTRVLDWLRIPGTVLSAVCFGFLLYIHVSSIDYAVQGTEIPYFLDIALFPIWILAIVVMSKRQRELDQPVSGFLSRIKRFYQAMLGEAPIWVVVVVGGVYLYTMVFGFIFSVKYGQLGVPDIVDGKHVLNNHGSITELTEAEYLDHLSQHIKFRTISLMLFYSAGFGILFPRQKPADF